MAKREYTCKRCGKQFGDNKGINKYCSYGCALPKEQDKRKNHLRAYHCWSSMKDRCQNPNAPKYHHYGGRGVTVCERWQSFDNFLADMGDPPDRMTLDRVDNSKGYHIDNCRWATQADQMRNRRTNVWITANGETMCLEDWVAKSGIAKSTIRKRLRNGWSNQDAVTIQPNPTYSHNTRTSRKEKME